jgi:hypothetical protein
MTHISEVIGWKFNHQEGMSTVDDVITDFPGGIPSQSDQDAWTAEYEAHVAATSYKDVRRTAYPDIGDQLDALMKQLNYDRTQGRELIQDMDDVLGLVLAVKAKYKKPD